MLRTMEMTPLSSSPSWDLRTTRRSTNERRAIHMRVFVDVHVDPGPNHHAASAALAVVEGQRTQIQKPKRESTVTKLSTILKDPDGKTYTYAPLLQVCSSINQLKQIHAQILTNGLDQNIFLATKLVSLYAIWGAVEYARLIFDKIYKQDVFLWNAMVRGYARNGLFEEALTLYYQMQLASIQPDKFTFPFVLKACAGLSALQEGKEIHNYIVRSGFESDVFVATALIDMYVKCGSLKVARQLFDKMSTKNVVSWNAMIAGYAQNGHAKEAWAHFNQMQLAGVKPNSVTVASMLQVCAHSGDLEQGEWIHEYIVQSGFESDVFVGNSLIDMYAKCGKVEVALQLFEEMPERNVVSWSAMITGYTQNGHTNEALALFHQMQLAGVPSDSVTILSALQACTCEEAVLQGKAIHGYMVRKGFDLDSFMGNAVIDMYAKCGSIENACHMFDKMSKRDVVSWNAMIAGYAQNGHASEALRLFNEMQFTDVTPNSFTMVSILQACARLGDLQQGMQIHDYVIQSELDLDPFVANSLVDMYAKCGNAEVARQLFERMSKRNVVSWNAMIAGYAHNRHGNEALTLFCEMLLADMKPDLCTMLSVLQACVHLASLQQCKWVHGYVVRSGFESNIFIVNSLVDMYAKCGTIDIARQLFDRMSKRNVVSWSTMIAGYGMHGHGEKALALYIQMQQAGMKPDHVTFTSVLSACSHAGLVAEGWQYFNSMIKEYSITPRMEHYACMVDLLGRAGYLDEAKDFIEGMPLEPGASIWGALLAACRIHCDSKLGEHVAEHLFVLEPENAGFYILLSNVYAVAGRWDDVARVRKLMKDRGLKKTPGCSWIEVHSKVHLFFVGDRSHPQSEKIYATLETLAGQMKDAGYVPNTNFVMNDVEE